jgi:hypothetical protein
MLFTRINQSSPEQVFMSVYNSHSEDIPTGAPAFFHYTGGTTPAGRGYQVTLAGTDTNYPPHPGNFAGVAAKRPILSEDFGSVQVWGWCDFILVQGTTSGNFVTVAGTGANELTNIVLLPVGIYGNGTNEGAATDAGYMGVVTFGDWSDYGGGFIVPVDGFYTQNGYGDVGTTLVTMTDAAVRYCKGHIRAL